MKGYLLNVSTMRRYTLWLWVKKSAANSCPWGIWHISGKHRLDCLLGPYAGYRSCNDWHNQQCLHLIWASRLCVGIGCLIFSIPLWFPCRSLSILSYSSGGIHTLISLQQYSILYCELISWTPEVLCYPWGLHELYLTSHLRLICIWCCGWDLFLWHLWLCLIYQVQSVHCEYLGVTLWVIYSFLEGNQLRWSAKTFSFPGLYTIV